MDIFAGQADRIGFGRARHDIECAPVQRRVAGIKGNEVYVVQRVEIDTGILNGLIRPVKCADIDLQAVVEKAVARPERDSGQEESC